MTDSMQKMQDRVCEVESRSVTHSMQEMQDRVCEDSGMAESDKHQGGLE